MTCPDLEQLERFVTRQSSADSSASVASHVEGCSSCKMRLSEIEENLRLLGDLSPHSFSLSAGKLPETIGPYSVVRLLGEGGMGVVYEAMQAHPRRAVALKVIRGNYAGGWIDEHHVKLFQREVQTLARLKHAHIASIYDAGRTDDGRPFFAMEMVSGVPLTHYAESQKLPVRERLGLFAKVCDAINYAHQRGVVHRDLKPSNILIDADGTPKVLDFGLAKLTDADVTATTITTETGRIQGTLAYMSPEQAAGNPNEIDLRSDVYSLGVILFEFLTGSLPYDVQRVLLPEAIRVIREEPPRKPSTIHKTLRGDLETIVLKALEKERDRRYQFAAELSQDIQRYLRGEAIMARPPSVRYQLRVLARRHKGLLAAVTTVFAVLVLGIAATGIALAREKTQRRLADEQRIRAVDAEARSQRRFDEVRRLAHVFIFDVHNQIEELPGSTPVRQFLVTTALHYLDRLSNEASEDPLLQRELADAYEKLGDVQGNPSDRNLGDTTGALTSYEKCLRIREALSSSAENGDDAARFGLSDIHKRIGDVLAAIGQTGQASAHYDESLRILQGSVDTNSTDSRQQDRLASMHNRIAQIQETLGASDEALASFQKMLAIYEAMATIEPHNTDAQGGLANALDWVGFTLQRMGKIEEAEANFRKSLRLREAMAGSNPDNAQAQRNLSISQLHVGEALEATGNNAQALEHFRLCVSIDERLAVTDPANMVAKRDLWYSHGKVGDMLIELGQFAEAAESYGKSLVAIESFAAADPKNLDVQRDLLIGHGRLGDIRAKGGRTDEALEHYRRSLQISEALIQAEPNNVPNQYVFSMCHLKIGEVLEEKGEMIDALAEYEDAVRLGERMAAASPDHVVPRQFLVHAYLSVGDACKKLERADAALNSYRKGLGTAEALLSTDPRNADCRHNLALLYRGFGKLKRKAAENGEVSRDAQLTDWREARSWFQRSFDEFNRLNQEGILVAVLAAEPERIAAALTQCDAALAELEHRQP